MENQKVVEVEPFKGLTYYINNWTIDNLCVALNSKRNLESETFETYETYHSGSLLSLYHEPAQVDFSEDVEIHEIPSLTKKQKNTLWYPDVDKKQSKHGKIPVRLLLCGQKLEEKRIRLRKCQIANEKEEKDVRLPVSAVLDEQQNQRDEGWNDPDLIAKMYHQCSSHSIVMAQMRALQDEREIQEYVNTNETCSNSDRWKLSNLLRLSCRSRAKNIQKDVICDSATASIVDSSM